MATPRHFRVGRVTAYARNTTWYLRYREGGRCRQVRAGIDKAATRQLAAQVNAQLEVGAPAATSFEPVGVPELRRRWLEHHEADIDLNPRIGADWTLPGEQRTVMTPGKKVKRYFAAAMDARTPGWRG